MVPVTRNDRPSDDDVHPQSRVGHVDGDDPTVQSRSPNGRLVIVPEHERDAIDCENCHPDDHTTTWLVGIPVEVRR